MRSVRYASCSAATTQLHLLGHDRRVAVALVERPGRTRTRSGSPCQTRVKQSATRRGAGRTARSALHTRGTRRSLKDTNGVLEWAVSGRPAWFPSLTMGTPCGVSRGGQRSGARAGSCRACRPFVVIFCTFSISGWDEMLNYSITYLTSTHWRTARPPPYTGVLRFC
jgi:hypothetical protein